MPSIRAPESRSAALFLVMTILAALSLVACGSHKQPQPRPVQVPLGQRDKNQQPLHLRQANN